ncbi:ImmA/IrrE family metallo-endopeptidase [bacterium]|nr:ImmA/IrrE family metallo-endopeptidase [bacterium]
MKLRRGFKSEANAISRELRAELNLEKHDPLCPWELADYLEISISPISSLATAAPSAIDYLMGSGSKFMSAVTIFGGRHGLLRHVYHNDGHARTRQAANISHELSHAILGHPPTEMFSPDPVAEQEAHWLGPALLVSEEAATRIAYRGIEVPEAAEAYGVSKSLMQMRLNNTGALIRAQRSRRRSSS